MRDIERFRALDASLARDKKKWKRENGSCIRSEVDLPLDVRSVGGLQAPHHNNSLADMSSCTLHAKSHNSLQGRPHFKFSGRKYSDRRLEKGMESK